MDAFDVAVIGGGIAGLVTARDLERAGYRVGLLESRPRFGGRIATVRSVAGGPAIELGAEFVHGSPPETLELLGEAHVTRSPVGHTELARTRRGWDCEPRFFEQVESVLDTVSDEPRSDQSFRSWINEGRVEPAVRDRALSYVEGFFASFAEKISTAGLAREERATREHGDASSRLGAGYGSLVGHLVRTLGRTALKTDTWVNAVHWSPEGGRIAAMDRAGHYECAARRVVVTLPIGVLQAPEGTGRVRFDPTLSSKAAAIDAIDAGVARRITFEFRDSLWHRLSRLTSDLDDLGFLHFDGCQVPVFWTSFPTEAQRLVGWVGGHRAARLPHALLERAALATLAYGFGLSEVAMRQEILAVHSHDWLSDPHSSGVYSYVKVGGSDAPRRLADPVDDVIFFAGEATHHEGELGTVAAAIATGHRAAGEILSLHR